MKMKKMVAALLVMGLYGCGSSRTTTSSTPTPTPAPPPVTTVIGNGSCTGLNVNFLCFINSVVTSQAGNLTVTVDWTFPQDAIQVLVVAGSQCTLAQINAGQCNFLAMTQVQTTPKPAVLTVHGAAAGTYWLYVGNRGPQIESISYQITLTTGAASVSSPRQQGMSLGDARPYVSQVEPR